MFSTLYQRDSLSQLSKDVQKYYHRNLPGGFDICSQMPSNSKKRFGLVDEISELLISIFEFSLPRKRSLGVRRSFLPQRTSAWEARLIRISNCGDGFQNASKTAQQSEILLQWSLYTGLRSRKIKLTTYF